MVKIAPSILAANFDNLENEIIDVIDKGADYIHVDIMDGKFVANETPGVEMYEVARKATSKIIDVHLMVENPEEWIEKFPKADIITFHVESFKDNASIKKLINKIHERKIKVGITLKPNTGVEQVLQFVDDVDMVLVMTVEPGFGGQKLLKECLDKVRLIHMYRPSLDIEVDGGINLDNISDVKEAGANVIVAGTAIFKAENRKKAIDKMKE